MSVKFNHIAGDIKGLNSLVIFVLVYPTLAWSRYRGVTSSHGPKMAKYREPILDLVYLCILYTAKLVEGESSPPNVIHSTVLC